MTATVLRGKAGSGSSNGTVSYTNSTGGNVRVIINYADSIINTASISMSWGTSGTSLGTITESNVRAFGKNIATASSLQNLSPFAVNSNPQALPVELVLTAGDTFLIVCNNYNILIIPEAG